MPALRLGYKASAEQFPPQRLLDLAVAAERAGFDSVWTSDHFQPWRHHGGHAPNALVWLGAATQATTRVTLGTSVLTPTLRYNPAVVAQAFGTLALLAPGRPILGVGTGESLNETPIGVPWPEQSERFARLREATQLIQQLWRGERLTIEGEYYRTANATIYDRPEEPVPVYIAASGPAAARLAGRIGDGLICTSGKGEELYTQTLLPGLAEGAEKAGVIGLTKAAGRELAHWNILVNAVAPGLIETDMAASIPAEAREAMLQQVPLKRIGQGREVAEVVRFLAGDGASYITGQTIHVNGGLYV
jgi:coenzyme F420-dependent glucose-6-phosphate dehydrogenase